MTYQQQTAVAEVTTALGSLSFYFSYAAAVTTMAVAMVSSVEMIFSEATTVHASSLFYFFFAAAATAITAAVAVDADCS